MPARIGPRLCRFVLVFARLWLHEDGMHRRRFIASLGAIALPCVAAAQQKTMPVVGYLNGTNPEANAVQLAAFRQGLSETGWVEGQNLNIEYRWAEFRYDQLPGLAAISSSAGSMLSRHAAAPMKHSWRKMRPRPFRPSS
jgi:hypothetical protein